MRRNQRNPRGGNRGVPAWQTQRTNGPRATGGPVPLMSDQLGLQDIDKELDLLKRKREIIEQQQQILSTDYRRNDYQDTFNQNQNTRFDDYAQLYDDTRTYETSRKRPIAVWEDDIPSKRFSGGGGGGWNSGPRAATPRSAPNRFGQSARSGYQGSAPRQPFRAQSTPFKPKANQPRRDNIPKASPTTNRVTKRPAAPINKLNTYPNPERKKLVATAVAVGTPSKPYELDESNRLVLGQEPNKQVNGRLELALGGVIRDIREKYDSIVKAPSVMRRIKQTVRSRIRELMMNKIVCQGPAIKTMYREVYSEDTDLEVVADALSDELKLVKIDNPKEYFKANMFVIMHMKLKSLLEKLEQTALEEYENDKPTESGDEPAEAIPADEEAVATTEETENIEEASMKEETMEESTEKTTEVAEEINESSDATVTKAENDNQLNNTLDENIIDTKTYKTLEMLMTKQMTALLKKSIPQIIKLMDIDAKYAKLKSSISAETVKMLSKKQNNKQDAEQSGDVSTKANKERSKRPPIPYFVKLMGKPSLPKRNQMQVFLDQFSPKSIKKHRAIHNLLFIGMMEKECFDKLLAADGTVIGKSTLSIRVSERSVPDEKNANDTADTSAAADLNTSNTDDKIIGEELDDQITDLLTSIRQAEEETGINNDIKEEDDANAEVVDVDAEAGDADANAEVQDANAETTEEAPQENGSNEEKPDQVPELADVKPVKGTPARASTRLAATPSRVQTRRTSKLLQNDA